MNRIVLHLDMDAFYAAVEVRDDPSLRGKPLIVGHRGRRGVVSTCSYEARRFGVHSAMPSVVAERLCPDAIWLRGRMERYVEVSRAIRRLMDEFSPVVEPISIDEAFLDLSGIAADLTQARESALALKRRVREQQQLTASVGLAPNKFLAKVASDMEKPDGLVLLPIEAVPDRLWPLPVRRLWGVGPRTAERLEVGGVRTIGDVARTPAASLERLLGPGGAAHLQRLAHGIDDRRLEPRRRARSISEERTYGDDLRGRSAIERAILARAEGVSRQLRNEGLKGRTVHLKVRTGDFTTWTRSLTLSAPSDLAEDLARAGRELFRERIELGQRGVRLLGLGVSGLDAADAGQRPLFSDPDEQRARTIARATDAVRDRMGERAVTRARLLRSRSDDEAGPDEASSLPSVD